MAHIEQQIFCNSVRRKFPDHFREVFAMDIGSLDINGNNRVYFKESMFIGVDIAVGKNVDIVSKGHEINLPDETLDTVISTECFEHDQYYAKTLINIVRMIKPGGMFIFTCATTGRPEHGTRRTTPEDAPLLMGDVEWSDYYKNLTEEDIKEVIDVDNVFAEYEFSVNNESYDLYFWGIKKGDWDRRSDYSFQIPQVGKHPFICKLSVDTPDGTEVISKTLDANYEVYDLTFDFVGASNISAIRLEPMDDRCVIVIDNLKGVIKGGEFVELKVENHNACVNFETAYFFHSFKPQIEIAVPKGDVIQVVCNIKYIHTGEDALNVCVERLIEDKEILLRLQNDQAEQG